ncbi:hypothetical protein GGI25_000542 [Coemansia spiralis]|uniref:DUF4112 domain-containing protein n=2 Tax=Coemansia TaxID=4863 RepID=A0A9W8L0C8_9FUNG|nr:hypothetical protein BX070DRAFT_236732 [Coemansia spiralis]KAJ1996003.1 hypothetical protein EDC05_000371 [Coemansia umbellata]KAJ2625446.1 hypothetical protein GGI26_000586 [Coemansia sp. RSA 1358]KAJ2680569.1 hypothetical protein GGI25_000542 [Coemansia spiralis]
MRDKHNNDMKAHPENHRDHKYYQQPQNHQLQQLQQGHGTNGNKVPALPPRHTAPAAPAAPASIATTTPAAETAKPPNNDKRSNLKEKHPKHDRDPRLMPRKTVDKKLKKLRRHAKWLDARFKCCYCIPLRFGVESLVGLIPVIGDFAGIIMALLFMSSVRHEFNIPANIASQMMINIALDFAVGLIPIIGDLADMAFKANQRNYNLIEQYVEEKQAEAAATHALEMNMATNNVQHNPPQHPHAGAASYFPQIALRPGAKTKMAQTAIKHMHTK